MCERIAQWHPLRPIIASISTSGVVYIWATNYTGAYLDEPCYVFFPANYSSRPFFGSITRELVGLRPGLHRTPGERGVRGARRRVRHCTLLYLLHRLLTYNSRFRCVHVLWVRPKTRMTKARARNVSESMSPGRYAQQSRSCIDHLATMAANMDVVSPLSVRVAPAGGHHDDRQGHGVQQWGGG